VALAQALATVSAVFASRVGLLHSSGHCQRADALDAAAVKAGTVSVLALAMPESLEPAHSRVSPPLGCCTCYACAFSQSRRTATLCRTLAQSDTPISSPSDAAFGNAQRKGYQRFGADGPAKAVEFRPSTASTAHAAVACAAPMGRSFARAASEWCL